MSDFNQVELPLNSSMLQQLEQYSVTQLAWLSGYCWAKSQQSVAGEILSPKTVQRAVEPLKITVLSASQTGNARGVAQQLAEKLKELAVEVNFVSASDFKAKKIVDEKYLFMVTSTQGEGEPPEEALPLFNLLKGKKAPKLANLNFAVLGLGDSSYPDFCQAAKDADALFEKLGGSRLLVQKSADTDFTEIAESWIAEVYQLVDKLVAEQATSTTESSEDGASVQTAAKTSIYTKENPFKATLLTNQKITSSQSEKDVRHLEFDSEGSELHYQPGDTLGVWFKNDDKLVDEFLQVTGLSGDEKVNLKSGEYSLHDALLGKLEITQNTPFFIRHYSKLNQNDALLEATKSSEAIQQLTAQTAIIDILKEYPTALSAEQLVSLLRPLAPRLYSIASSEEEVGDEVHLTVGVARFERNGEVRSGAASSYLADRVEEDGEVEIYIETNPHFRLPADLNKPIIMIGSGTGIAPFRSFVQQRAVDEATGKNWLIFGNQHFLDDFLYQIEWQEFAKQGYLSRVSLAWSRDQQEKIYVQDKIRQEAKELWKWLEEGAHIYVCGDASRMARDVEKALLEVIIQEGQLDEDAAQEYLDELRSEKRYQRDVY